MMKSISETCCRRPPQRLRPDSQVARLQLPTRARGPLCVRARCDRGCLSSARAVAPLARSNMTCKRRIPVAQPVPRGAIGSFESRARQQCLAAVVSPRTSRRK